MSSDTHERSPLLGNGRDSRDGREGQEEHDEREVVSFSKDDEENPRNWSQRRKMANVAVIAAMSIMGPLAGSMFTPGIQQIADDLGTDYATVIGVTTGVVIMLGVGPLILAPLSETFGRRKIFLICFTIFTLLNIPTALAPDIATLIFFRTVAGFFSSVGIANGGGTISDMFVPSERAAVFGWYLLGPLLGPTIGPLVGGVTVQRLGWRWIFWLLTIFCAVNTIAGYIFLRESYAPVILTWRRDRLEKDEGKGKYRLEQEDTRPLWRKLATSFYRPVRILAQPIVLTMSTYQALIFATTFSLYTNMQQIYSGVYGFNSEQVGLTYLGPGLGFLFGVRFLVPRIDTIYNKLTKRNDGESKPEFRLPLANVGAMLLPVSLFWFGWTVEYKAPWWVTVLATFPYGISQTLIFNCVQNYYIDSFERYAASAIAAGALFRSLAGGIVPLFAPGLFEKLGYGWGISVFAFIAVMLAPAPLVFYFFGERIRERFRIEL